MVSKQVIKEILIENQERIPKLDLVNRDINIDYNTNYVFVGLRRAGKSYTIYQNICERIKNGKNNASEILYLNFEDDRLDEFNISDFQTILVAYNELYPNLIPVVYLDEIQIIDGWEKFARRLADQNYRVYVTGSNATMLGREIATTLGGRFVTREIYPFSFFEYLQYKGVEFGQNWHHSTKTMAQIRNLFDEYFYYGGFAENINKTDKREWLNILLKKILLGDIILRNKIRESNNILLLTKKLAESVMQPSSKNHLCNILKSTGSKITRETIADYLSEMQNAYLIFQLRNYTDSFVEKTMKNKTYFSDNGLLTVNTLDTNAKLLENIVAIHLWKKYGAFGTDGLYYYHKNVKVDFYIPEKKIAIQVCYNLNGDSGQTRSREINTLLKAGEFLKVNQMIIITMDEEYTIDVNHQTINILPVWKWLLDE